MRKLKMPKHKTLTVLERRIEETQASLMRAKARYDRRTQELQATANARHLLQTTLPELTNHR